MSIRSPRRPRPSLDGAVEGLIAEPLDRTDLRGRVVLVNVWTLTCINWLRTAPYVRSWWNSYHDDGLIVIGVHTPEFSFEHDVERVRRATTARGLEYPIAVDSEFAVWNAFDNHYWPALYFVDRDGAISDQHFGEGRYERSERTIQRLLGIDRALTSVEGTGVEREADWRHLRSPETYLGYSRAERFASPTPAAFDEARVYEPHVPLPENAWTLRGNWTIAFEQVVLQDGNGSIAYRYRARDAHIVMSAGTDDPIPFEVRLDGEAPGPSHGLDIDENGRGVLADGRLYQLARAHDRVQERTLEITFLEPGAEAYVFTFG
jgi:hypothetical protein